jgi:hypothetical protein
MTDFLKVRSSAGHWRQRLGDTMHRNNLFVVYCGLGMLCSCMPASGFLGSVFVKSQLIRASQGGTITLTQADGPTLAGTQVVILPNALTQDTRITVGLVEASMAPAGARSAGPAVDLGPSGTQFKAPAVVTLPFVLPTGATTDQLVITALESSGVRYQVARADLHIAGGLVSFAVSSFTVFEADVIAPPPGDGGPADGGPVCSQDNASCGVDSDCCSGFCPGSDIDAGIAGICSEPADGGPPDGGPMCLLDTSTCSFDSDCCSGYCPGSDSDAGISGICWQPTGDGGPPDAGPADAGPVDAGPPDAGLTDAGPTDGGACLVDYSFCSFDSDCCSGLCPGSNADAGVSGLCSEPLCIDAGLPGVGYTACNGDAGPPGCTCPFACLSDPGLGRMASGIWGFTCEATCNQGSDCLDPISSCVAGSCNLNFCVADWPNNPKPGVLGQVCDAQDAGSGTCLPLGTNPGSTQVGVCTQGGTATVNAPCTPFWPGPAPGVFPNPSTEADQLCTVGNVCVWSSPPDAGGICLALGDGGCVVGLGAANGTGPNFDLYVCQSNLQCQCPAQCVIDASAPQDFTQVCESPCLVDADCPLAVQRCNTDAGTCSVFMCAQDSNGSSLPGTLNGSCGANDAGNCFPSASESLVGICTLAGDAGLKAPCDFLGNRDNPSRLCAQGIYCAYGTLDAGARVCVGMCDPTSDAGTCTGPNEICSRPLALDPTVGYCCLPFGATCTHDQACCNGCDPGGTCS